MPNGTYKALAYGPYLSAGMSNNVTVDENVTYYCAIVLVPQPYYGNMTVSENPIGLEGEKTEITITVYDYWENPVGPGWMVTTHTTAGTLDPLYGLTDANSQFRTTLTSPDNGSYAEINEFIRGWNGTYYPLQKRITVVQSDADADAEPVAHRTAFGDADTCAYGHAQCDRHASTLRIACDDGEAHARVRGGFRADRDRGSRRLYQTTGEIK